MFGQKKNITIQILTVVLFFTFTHKRDETHVVENSSLMDRL